MGADARAVRLSLLVMPRREGWDVGKSVANSVKAIRPGPFGTTIVLNDSLAARRIILEQTGTLKHPLAATPSI